MPVNDSEAYLTSLARKSFLSMWSYANPGYGTSNSSNPGKELCDLLVVFENIVILFSDKNCVFPNSGDANLDWKRWYRRAVRSSVNQLNGAKRTLIRSPEQIHEDLSLTLPFPLTLPPAASARFFLVAVAHGSKDACLREFGRPSLAIDTRVSHDESRLTFGCTFEGQFVHVLDDATLETILTELDTISDFVTYLSEKEAALASNSFYVAGEENLLAIYMTNRDDSGRHAIPISDGLTTIADGEWNTHKESDRYARSKEENRISYNMDNAVEHFTHAYASRQMVLGQEIDFARHEEALRLLASESRFGRRIISTSLVSILQESATNTFWASTVGSSRHDHVRYVFLTYPQPPSDLSLEKWEQAVLNYLSYHLLIARHVFERSNVVIGIGTPNPACTINSQFIRILDGRTWTSSDHEEAAKLQRSTGIFANMQEENFLHIE